VVSIWGGGALEDRVFVGPNVAFTNDPGPWVNAPLEAWSLTKVLARASLGAKSTILPGNVISSRAMIGTGWVVTRSASGDTLVTRTPAHVCEFAPQLSSEGTFVHSSCELAHRLPDCMVAPCP
jgi:UDP-2-acetamido-3-amino-2,3-dideoxy-glucuronate N-acetyltransferase